MSRPGETARAGTVDPLQASRVLVVDDDTAVREMTTRMLSDSGYLTSTANDGDAALREIEAFVPDLVITDLNMPRTSGFELLEVLRQRFPQMPVIATSGEFTGDALPPGVIADAFLSKSGGSLARLRTTVRELLAIRPFRAGAQSRDVLDDCGDADMMQVFGRLGMAKMVEPPVGLGGQHENPSLQSVPATSAD